MSKKETQLEQDADAVQAELDKFVHDLAHRYPTLRAAIVGVWLQPDEKGDEYELRTRNHVMNTEEPENYACEFSMLVGDINLHLMDDHVDRVLASFDREDDEEEIPEAQA